MRDNFIDSTTPAKNELNTKHMVGVDKEKYTNLHMDENDDISPPRGSASATSHTAVDDENDAFQMDEGEPNRKLPRENKLSTITTQDGNSKGNLLL